jgi:hypothetical protein
MVKPGFTSTWRGLRGSWYDAIEKVPPAMPEDSFAAYAGGTVPGVDMDQL